eukprot:367519_1
MGNVTETDADSDDDNNEVIINPGNDRRVIVCDSQNKTDAIIQCIGTIDSQYIPDKTTKQKELCHGTGTVIHIDKENNIYVLSAAHNIRGTEKECKQCHVKTIKRNCYICSSKTQKTGQLIKPKDIYFVRRGITKQDLGETAARYQVENYQLPAKYTKFPKGNDGYDICIIIFKCVDKNEINLYKKCCSNLELISDHSFGGDNCVSFIYGYPGNTRKKENGRIYYYMYGMGTSKIDQESKLYVDKNEHDKLYIVNKCIDTAPGQSGSCIYSYNEAYVTKYLIYGVHTSGSEKRQSNFGTFFDDENIQWIEDVFFQNNCNVTVRKKTHHIKSRKAVVSAWTYEKINITERSELRKRLLEKTDMKTFEKIQLCFVECNWQKKSEPNESILISNKSKILKELLEFYRKSTFKSLDILRHTFKLLWLNLFRTLPDQNSMQAVANEDVMNFHEPSWEHLEFVYKITFYVLINPNIDKRIMIGQLRGKFLQNLVCLLKSLDDRETQYVKIIIHAIYGRFMALRGYIRTYLSQFCYSYIYETEYELCNSIASTKWQGIPEILQIFCSIIQGLSTPVKKDYYLLLCNVLIPLHKTYHLDAFHDELVKCCTQFILKDPQYIVVILGGLLKFWPKISPLKEQLFINEIVQLLDASSEYIRVFGKHNIQLKNIIIATIHKLCKCILSDHYQVAERSLLIWKHESLKLCLELYSDKCWSILYYTLSQMTQTYWSDATRNIAKIAIDDLPQFVHQKHYKFAELRKYDHSKAKEREFKWEKIKQLAKRNAI